MLRKGSTWGSGGGTGGYWTLSIEIYPLTCFDQYPSVSLCPTHLAHSLALKRTTLASDESLPDLLMPWALGLPPCHPPPVPSDVSVTSYTQGPYTSEFVQKFWKDGIGGILGSSGVRGDSDGKRCSTMLDCVYIHHPPLGAT